jgi:aryl-alcohol dehydrogenase-like predicted oxidoreductase/enamine deaminase RidA (YjgF/YER057c/UK114 family)
MSNRVEYCELAPDLKISRVLTGLWQVADMERDGKTLDLVAAAKSMKAYGDAGLVTFDMADHYGSAEVIAGIYKKKYADYRPVNLLTKWVPSPGQVTKKDVREAVATALVRMNMEQLDLMQFHAWNYADPIWLDCLYWLEELREEGLLKQIGLTNFDAAHLNMVLESGIKVVSNQVSYSLLDQRAKGDMAAVCEKHGVKILAFGTLAGGFLTEKWLGKPEPKQEASLTWSQMKYKRFVDVAGGWKKLQDLLQVLSKLSEKYHVSMANVATRYMLEQPAVGGVIVGARLGESEHVMDNLRLFDFRLDADSKKAIENVIAGFIPIPGDCGDEYRKPPFLTASGDLSHHVEAIPVPYPTTEGSDGRTKALSGTEWEDLAGFSRAVKKGNRILISGTTATHGAKAIGGNDPAAQATFALDKIEGALQSLGATMEEVVRTRIFVKNIDDWEAVARVHGKRFKDIQPANTLVQANLVGREYLVEIEAEAMVE